jgi:hypothetical protein
MNAKFTSISLKLILLLLVSTSFGQIHQMLDVRTPMRDG